MGACCGKPDAPDSLSYYRHRETGAIETPGMLDVLASTKDFVQWAGHAFHVDLRRAYSTYIIVNSRISFRAGRNGTRLPKTLSCIVVILDSGRQHTFDAL